MKKSLIPILIILLFLSACNNDRVVSSDSQFNDSGKAAINQKSEDNAINPDVMQISKIRIKSLYDACEAEYTDNSFISEFCALFAGQTFSKINSEWDGDYQVELLSEDGTIVATMTSIGSVVTFDNDITINERFIKKGSYNANQWISDYVRKYMEGMVVDPVYIQYPAVISIPDNINYQDIVDKGSSKVNTYETIEQIYELLDSSFANNEFSILNARRLFDNEEVKAEEEKVKADGRCILIEFNTSETYLEVISKNSNRQFAKAHIVTLAANTDKPGTYKLITNSMVFEIEADREFNERFDDIFRNNRIISKNLTPDDIKKLYEENKTLYEENKPSYMEYVCKNLGIERWSGNPPNKIEITRQKLSKDGKMYTVLALSNPYRIRLYAFKGGNGHPWDFTDYIDFGGRLAGTEYRLESWDDHVWIVGNSCRGYGTGEARYYQDWYELTSEGKKLVLSFPYDEYFEHYLFGGHSVNADTISIETSGEMSVSVDYTITKIYQLNLDIADEYGRVCINTKKNVEFIWDEAMMKFVSEYDVDESGLTVVEAEYPEITRQCDDILEKYYAELLKMLAEVETEKNEFVRDTKIEGLMRFLRDCSDGRKKSKLTNIAESMKKD
jgi:hypothetical protein